MEGEQYLSFFCSVVHDNQDVVAIRSNPSFSSSISSLLEGLAVCLYEAVRPLIIDTMQIDRLCDLVRMIKMEIVAGDIIKRSALLPFSRDARRFVHFGDHPDHREDGGGHPRARALHLPHLHRHLHPRLPAHGARPGLPDQTLPCWFCGVFISRVLRAAPQQGLQVGEEGRGES